MPSQPLLIVVGGPTAAGKTRLAIELARMLGTEIISADSRQFYTEMRIGNARPQPAELAAVRHHFVSDRSLSDPLNAGGFAAEALERIRELHVRHRTVVMVGGSGLYIRAVTEGLDTFPPVSREAAQRVAELTTAEGLPGLQREVVRLDPDYYERVDRQNARRLERALRVCYSAGRPYSSFLGQQSARPFRTLKLRPAIDRKELYRRIDERVDHMLAQGLEAEARTLIPLRDLPVLQTVGYQEWWPYFDGDYDKDRAVELIKRNSRRYAKRQLTWFRDYPEVGDATAALRLLDTAYL